MVVLNLALVTALLTGCYEPELVDCTVACSAPTDCAGDQVCGSDGHCAAPSIAGTCATGGGVLDGGTSGSTVKLQLVVQGAGVVTIDGLATCGATTKSTETCTFEVPKSVPVTLTAGSRFEKWVGLECSNTTLRTCVVPMLASANVVATFAND